MPYTLEQTSAELLPETPEGGGNRWTLNFGPQHPATHTTLRLVLSVARQYEGQGMPLLDVIEEGNIGLMRAVERFNPDLECRFSTYAVHWIKQAIRQGEEVTRTPQSRDTDRRGFPCRTLLSSADSPRNTCRAGRSCSTSTSRSAIPASMPSSGHREPARAR